jgi:hypothetical protein
MNKTARRDILTKYMPIPMADFILDLIHDQKNLQLVFTRSRKSRYGDYSSPNANRGYHRITVNHNLEPTQLFITLLHEIAHYHTRLEYQEKVQPHGQEWRFEFRKLLSRACHKKIFSPEMEDTIYTTFFKNDQIARASCSAEVKHKGPMVSELKPGDVFSFNDKIFRYVEQRRTRIFCVEVSQGRGYTIHGNTHIDELLPTQSLQEKEIPAPSCIHDAGSPKVEQLEEGDFFLFDNKVWCRGAKQRTRIHCTEVSTGKLFSFRAHTLIAQKLDPRQIQTHNPSEPKNKNK